MLDLDLELIPQFSANNVLWWAIPKITPMLTNAKQDSMPKVYKCKFIEPGLVHYEEFGTALVQKGALDKMANSFIGKPVVNVVHKDINPADFRREADGIVTDVWYNSTDGWYWAEFMVWDRATQHNCESSAYSVSCAYNVAELGEKGGEYHNIKYAQEVLDGEYTHLAVVANPRYEGARIVYNSKGGNMKLKFWEKKTEVRNATDIDLENAVVEIDGKEVPVKDLLAAHNSKKKTTVGIDTFVEVDGKETSIKDLIETYKNAKNADEDKDRKDKNLKEEEEKEMNNAHEKGSHQNAVENCAMCSKRKNELETERKNAADIKAKEDADAAAKALALKNAAERRGEAQVPELVTKEDRLKEGAKRYGSEKK